MPERLTEEEFQEMRNLIKRFAETELDQWAAWRTETRFGTVYISISRKPEHGATDAAYDEY